jgi:hypothetical protein
MMDSRLTKANGEFMRAKSLRRIAVVLLVMNTVAMVMIPLSAGMILGIRKLAIMGIFREFEANGALVVHPEKFNAVYSSPSSDTSTFVVLDYLLRPSSRIGTDVWIASLLFGIDSIASAAVLLAYGRNVTMRTEP